MSQMQAGTLRNPNNRITVDLTAIVNPVSVEDENTLLRIIILHKTFPTPLIHLQKLILD